MRTTIAFTGTLEHLEGHALLRFPAEASSQLPSRGQVAGTARIGEKEFTTVVEPDGRRGHWLDLEEALWTDLGLETGTTVDVEITPTKDWPEPTIPADLQAALDAAADLEGMWESLTPMARWEWVRWVKATKNPDTRARRVEVTLDKMRNGKRRPCCFDLSSCTVPELAKSGKLIEA